ncbi:MAG: 16S rRNA (guanine(527)-N(7))-methyltransferase RsmG [Tissierellia bacterium]|nr:16S rRNA (guanine(527)-N(7))-methyltransferase RsmG [Tissierellia bacterium]
MDNNIFELSGISLDDKALQLFETYRQMILDYNKIMDITNITDYDQMYIKHFVDSLLLERANINLDNVSLIDIGTGGGFPGIPLKIAHPTIDLTLLDSLRKRITFLTDLIRDLNLKTSKAIHARAEEYAHKKEFREVFDLATSRAVAELRTLVEYCLAYVKEGGYFIAMKGPNYQEELQAASNAIKIMGGRLEEVIEYDLPQDMGTRSLIIIKKIKKTPIKYPRSQGKPRSKPL